MSRFFRSAWHTFKRHWLLSTILLLIVIGGVFWWFSKAAAQQEALTFIKPERENLVKTLEISGKVDAREKARLRFIAGGKLTSVAVKEGDRVTKWQTLAVIDQAALRKQLAQNVNTYTQERTDWEQLQDDTKDRVLPIEEQRQKDKAQLDLENRVLTVEMQDIAIRNTVLSAPFAGIITAAPATAPGVVLGATDYFEIVDPATLEFIAEVDEADIAKVQIAQPATLILDAFPDDTITTSVKSIAYTSKQGESGTVFEVTFEIPQAESANLLRLGMNGDVAIELATQDNALTVPLIATRQRDDKTYVDVRTGEKTYEEREITVGLETDEKIEVVSGLSADEEILSPESP